jgi:arsenate reductase-like glutaredoxin family protein
VLEGIDDLYATKGKNVIHLDLTTGNATRAEIEALLIGPSGNLRAPTVRKGKTLLVGFDEATYARFVK